MKHPCKCTSRDACIFFVPVVGLWGVTGTQPYSLIQYTSMWFSEKIGQMMAVADPGFPRGGGANSPGGAPTYDFAKFFQKLHEI